VIAAKTRAVIKQHAISATTYSIAQALISPRILHTGLFAVPKEIYRVSRTSSKESYKIGIDL